MNSRAGIRFFLPILLLVASTSRAHAMYSYSEVVSTLQALSSRPQSAGGPRLEIKRIGTTVKGRAILMGALNAPAAETTEPVAVTAEKTEPAAQPEAGGPAAAPTAVTAEKTESAAQPEAGGPAAPFVVDNGGSLNIKLDVKGEQAAEAKEEAPAPAAQDAPQASASKEEIPGPGLLPEIPQEKLDGPRRVLFICRQHGNEPASTEAAMQFLKEYAVTDDPAKIDLLRRVTFLIIPMLNADGAEKYSRRNGRNVDLNRDWGNQSQPETQAVVQAAAEWNPDLIVDAHELAASDSTPSFVEAMEPEAGPSAEIGDADNGAIAAVVGPLRAQAIKIYARPVYNYREPQLSHRYFSVKRDIPTILIETHRAGNTPLEQRVATHYAGILAVGRYLAGEELNTPTRVVADWLEPGASGSYRATVARRAQAAPADAVARALSARRNTMLASRGGNADATAKKREALRKKLLRSRSTRKR